MIGAVWIPGIESHSNNHILAIRFFPRKFLKGRAKKSHNLLVASYDVDYKAI